MKKRQLLLGLIIIFLGYFFWAHYDRHWETSYQYKPVKFAVFNKDSATGNVIGMQVYMTNLDYRTASTFYNKLDYYLKQAQQKKWIKQHTTVVFPEHIATWLVAANEKKSVFKTASVSKAMQTIVLSHLPAFLGAYIKANASDKSKEAIFQFKAKEMLRIYLEVFSKLAKKYKVTIVAGSIFLPNPVLKSGKIKIRKGPLYNVSAVFAADGNIRTPLILKKFPTQDELTFCEPSSTANSTFTVSRHKMGVLICADAWFPQNYQELGSQKASVVLVPAYSAGNNLWATQWQGYNKLKGRDVTPNDIDVLDVNAITEGVAWYKYTLVRVKKAGIKTAIAVFLRGTIWDLGTDGRSFILQNGQLKSIPKTEAPVIFNVDL